MGFPLDALTDILTAAPAGPAQPMSYRQGTIVEWNPLTAENKVNVGGTIVEDIPILNTTEALLLSPGAVVGLMIVGSTWAIIGRLIVPGTPDAASALNAVLTDSADVFTLETTTSDTYTDLTTEGPTLPDVIVGASRRLLVLVSTEIRGIALQGASIRSAGGFMSFDLAGATTQAASDANCAEAFIRYNDSPDTFGTDIELRISATRAVLLTGLNPGSHSLTAKYRSAVAGVTATFFQRSLIAIVI